MAAVLKSFYEFKQRFAVIRLQYLSKIYWQNNITGRWWWDLP